MENAVEKYVHGWIAGDAGEILGVLADDCTIIESHGPAYHGAEEVKAWVDDWVGKGSRVDRWEITSFGAVPPDKAVFEWKFECTVGGEKHSLEGVSIVRFDEGKISYMREYRMVKR